MISNPLFIIGTERSGSNLLRLMLNAHPEIAVPHPPHIMRNFTPFSNLYGDLSEEQNFRTMITDVLLSVRTHFAPWPIQLDAETVLSKAKSRSLYGVYVVLYEQYLQHCGKRRWGCKSTFMYRHIAEILNHHQAPRFIHLVRDPRDVAASSGESVFSRFHPYNAAKLWVEQQSEIEQWDCLREEGKLLRVRYEDLVLDPEFHLKKIMAFLDEEYFPEQLNFHKSEAAQRLSRLSDSWKNCQHPTSPKSVGQFRRKLNERETQYVEGLAATLMSGYGYTLVNASPSLKIGQLESIHIEISELWRKLGVEGRAMFSDKNFSLRWKSKLLLNSMKMKQQLKQLKGQIRGSRLREQ